MSVKAYLFDMDGTLADSEKIFVDKIYDLVMEHNFKGTYRDVELAIAGSTTDMAYEFIADNCGLSLEEAAKTFNEMFNYGHYHYKNKIYKETKEVLAALKSEGYKLALVTANDKTNIDDFIGCGFEDIFDCVVSTQEDKLPRKPQPDCYLKAMQILNVKPHECIVVEDSHMGIEAGVASEAYTIATTQSGMHVDTSHANRVINNLIELIR